MTFYFFRGDVMDIAFAPIQAVGFVFIDIETNDLKSFSAKLHDEGQTDVAQADHGDYGLFCLDSIDKVLNIHRADSFWGVYEM